MIERKLKDHGIEKVIPDDDVLAEAYLAFHRSQQLREQFEEIEAEFKATKIRVPKNLKERSARSSPRSGSALGRCAPARARRDAAGSGQGEKANGKKKSGDFTDADEDDGSAH